MSRTERRWMGVDLGAARIGIAVSDLLGLTARPLDPIHTRGPRKDLAALEERIREAAVDEVVIGLPLRLSGEEGESAKLSRAFAERLQLRNPKLVIHLWDERFTTVEAEDHLRSQGVYREKRRARVDSEAATILLQRFLDAEAGGSE